MITPGQLGPISLDFDCFKNCLTLIISCTGIPSVIHIIKGIFGTQYFQDANSCLKTFKNIIIEFSDTYKNTNETNGEKFLGNSSSKFSYHYFDFASGQRIGVQCYFFESGDVELSVSLVPSIELIKWLEEGNRSTSSDT